MREAKSRFSTTTIPDGAEDSNFVLEYEYKCDVLPNSGVQFRSNAYAIETVSGAEGKKKLVPAGRVPGYLEEIDPNNWDRMWRGGVIHRKAD